MATYRELAYAVSDFSKTISDDSIITIDHIIFLMGKYRNYILNSTYSTLKKVISDSNYQTICLDLEQCSRGVDFCGKEDVLVSTSPVPFTLTLGAKTVYPQVGFMYGRINFVNNMKFKYSGNNKFFTKEIYATIGPDGRLYLKSSNKDFLNLSKVSMTAIFSEPEKAAVMECASGCSNDKCVDNCDILDKHFPLDDSFLPTLMQLVVRDITGAAWKAKDDDNNANDDLARFANVLSQYTNQSFKNMMNGADNRE